jgi:hypothetical protein
MTLRSAIASTSPRYTADLQPRGSTCCHPQGKAVKAWTRLWQIVCQPRLCTSIQYSTTKRCASGFFQHVPVCGIRRGSVLHLYGPPFESVVNHFRGVSILQSAFSAGRAKRNVLIHELPWPSGPRCGAPITPPYQYLRVSTHTGMEIRIHCQSPGFPLTILSRPRDTCHPLPIQCFAPPLHFVLEPCIVSFTEDPRILELRPLRWFNGGAGTIFFEPQGHHFSLVTPHRRFRREVPENSLDGRARGAYSDR